MDVYPVIWNDKWGCLPHGHNKEGDSNQDGFTHQRQMVGLWPVTTPIEWPRDRMGIYRPPKEEVKGHAKQSMSPEGKVPSLIWRLKRGVFSFCRILIGFLWFRGNWWSLPDDVCQSCCSSQALGIPGSVDSLPIEGRRAQRSNKSSDGAKTRSSGWFRGSSVQLHWNEWKSNPISRARNALFFFFCN